MMSCIICAIHLGGSLLLQFFSLFNSNNFVGFSLSRTGYQFFLAKSKTKFTWKSLMQPHFDFSLIYCSNTNEQRFHVASLTWWSRDLFRLPENSFRRFFDVCSIAEIPAMLSHEKKPQPSSLRHTDNPEEPIFLSLGRLGVWGRRRFLRSTCLFICRNGTTWDTSGAIGQGWRSHAGGRMTGFRPNRHRHNARLRCA